MIIKECLFKAAASLKKAGIADPLGEAELFLSIALKRGREFVIAHPETRVPKRTTKLFDTLVSRRRRHEPVAYILGRQEFYGRNFIVTPATLIPRHPTETIIETTLEEMSGVRRQASGVTILDIGCGTGIIGLTLAAEIPGSRAVLVDASKEALAVARRNARRLGLMDRATFKLLDVTQSGPSPVHVRGRLIVAANLPYLKSGGFRSLAPGIRLYEPKGALVSGRDGLDHYRALMKRLEEWRLEPDLLLLEADPPQFRSLEKIVRGILAAYDMEIRKDLAGNRRILIAKPKPRA